MALRAGRRCLHASSEHHRRSRTARFGLVPRPGSREGDFRLPVVSLGSGPFEPANHTPHLVLTKFPDEASAGNLTALVATLGRTSVTSVRGWTEDAADVAVDLSSIASASRQPVTFGALALARQHANAVSVAEAWGEHKRATCARGGHARHWQLAGARRHRSEHNLKWRHTHCAREAARLDWHCQAVAIGRRVGSGCCAVHQLARRRPYLSHARQRHQDPGVVQEMIFFEHSFDFYLAIGQLSAVLILLRGLFIYHPTTLPPPLLEYGFCMDVHQRRSRSYSRYHLVYHLVEEVSYTVGEKYTTKYFGVEYPSE